MMTDSAPAFWVPLLTSLLAGAATGLGGIVVTASGRVPGPGYLAFSLALAGSVMITVSLFDLLLPALLADGFFWPSLTALAGAASFRLLAMFFPEQHAHDLLPVVAKTSPRPNGRRSLQGNFADSAESRGRSWRLGLIMFVSLTAHNLPEGLAVSVSSVNDSNQGIVVAIAIALHNIPEGLAIATPIYAATRDSKKAVGMALLSGLSEPLGALLALTVLRPLFAARTWLVEYVLVFVAGIMVAVAVVELLPEAASYRKPRHVCAGVVLGAVVMIITIVLLSDHE